MSAAREIRADEAVEDTSRSWLTPAQLGKRWGVSPDTIKREIAAGRIKAMPIRSTVRIHLSVVTAREADYVDSPCKPTLRRRRDVIATGFDHIGDVAA